MMWGPFTEALWAANRLFLSQFLRWIKFYGYNSLTVKYIFLDLRA